MAITLNGSGTITGVSSLATALVNPVVTTTIGVGNATPSASGAGITFPATQSASSDVNTLDDYEEGTWTPAIAGGSGTTYATQAGWYTKIGNLVTVGFDLALSAKGTISGNAQITGLPFTSGSSPTRAGNGFAVANGLGTSYVSVSAFIDSGSTTIDIYARTAASTTTTTQTGTSFFAATSQLIASLSYRI